MAFLIESSPHFQSSTQINLLSLFQPHQPIDSPDVVAIFEIRVLVSRKGLCANFSVPIFKSPYGLQLQMVFSELHFLLERQIQLSVSGQYGDFACPTRFAHCLNLDLLSPLTQTLQHLQRNRCLALFSQRRRMNLHLRRCLALVFQCWIMNLNSTMLGQYCLPNAGCRWLLIVEEDGQNPRRLRRCSSSHSKG